MMHGADDKIRLTAERGSKMRVLQAFCAGVLFGLLAFVTPAAARQGDHRPIIIVNPKPVNPEAYAWIGKSGVKALQKDIAEHHSGSLYAFVFAAAPSTAWDIATASKADFVSIGDLARRADQVCQYYNKGVPCFIVSINGHSALDANGNLPLQPNLLGNVPGTFDAAHVPFLTSLNRFNVAGYADAARPRALAVTFGGWYVWNTGKTVLDAIAKDQTACTKHVATEKGDTCLLYAIDDEVILSAPGASATTTVRAEAAEPAPIIVDNDKPVDLKAYPWLSESGVKALMADVAEMKSGTIRGFVFAAEEKDIWFAQPLPKSGASSVRDLARTVLQGCEYYASGIPCFILSVNGKDGRDSTGTLPTQPVLFERPPAAFDAARAPFVWNRFRRYLAGYGKAAQPRALVLTPDGYSYWNTGQTVLSAIEKDLVACEKHLATDKSDACLLYAVNDEVVFSPDEH